MTFWIDSKAWQTLFLFSLLSLYIGVKYFPKNLTPISQQSTKASYIPKQTTPHVSKQTPNLQSTNLLYNYSFDQTFNFSIKTRLSVYPSNTEVHLVGVHKGDDGKRDKTWWENCKTTNDGRINEHEMRSCHSQWAGEREFNTVKVNAILTEPSILVLMASEPVVWTIEANNNSLIKRVILIGKSAQQVNNLSENIPVEIRTYASSPTCTNCSRAAAIPFTYKSEGTTYKKTIESIQKITGISPTTFQGARISGNFTISSSTPRLMDNNLRLDMREGDIIDRTFTNTFNLSNITLSLPEGEWIGLVYQSTGKNSGEDQSIIFYRERKKILTGIYAVRLKLSVDGLGFTKNSSCQKNIGYASEVVSNVDHGNQLCYWVEHTTTPWKSPIFELTAKRLKKKGIEVPVTAIKSVLHDANLNSSTTSYYLTNPESVGIQTQVTSWLTSPWHPRKISTDTLRKSFVDEQVEWAGIWFQIAQLSK